MKNSFSIKIILFLAFAAFFISANFCLADVTSALNNAKGTAAVGYGDRNLESTITDIPTTIGRIIGVGLSFVGVLFLGLLIYGGFMWMVSRGNQAEVTKATDLIQAAVIGLIIVLAAYAITMYVGNILS